MTYFPDLSPPHYGGHLDSADWDAPLLAVGWLTGGQPYATGNLPQGFLDRLERLMAGGGVCALLSGFRGLHACELCVPFDATRGIDGSCFNYFIPGDGVIYLVPGGVLLSASRLAEDRRRVRRQLLFTAIASAVLLGVLLAIPAHK